MFTNLFYLKHSYTVLIFVLIYISGIFKKITTRTISFIRIFYEVFQVKHFFLILSHTLQHSYHIDTIHNFTFLNVNEANGFYS